MNILTAGEVTRQEALESSACRKAAIRLIPLLAIAYFFNYLDRTNVGFASLTMNEDLGLTASQFGFAAGIFMWAIACSRYPAIWRCTASVRGDGSQES